MDVQEIEVTIGKDGKVQVHVRGVQGKACLDITRALENALGGEVEVREMTPEAIEGIQLPEETRLREKGMH
ncbi:hypothetical protein LARV_02321 [Longilinea arvoryzae]|uniref:DUF2997 domain-containing protein n=1 Tax=Longilinea arvoryzae TaxID=360412 RepID=A0A0S7BHJ4_9CHLR|nr:DUF2997 domain-containing protein [Longilinea arvoryzae]GAP14548.1 hypothetical protein LARV_02321 [Longilinea arvoryzae]